MKQAICGAFIGVFACFPAFAADDGFCNGPVGFGEISNVRLMRVVSNQPRVQFYEQKSDKKKHCPAEVDTCQRKGFVVPGDDVLAGPERGAFACTTYIAPNAKKVKGQFTESNGFLQKIALAPVGAANPAPADWLGKWSRMAEGEITLSAAPGGKLKVEGEAYWGSLDPNRVARGAVNQGQLEGEAAPKGNVLALGEGYSDGTKPFDKDPTDCQARLRLFGRYLVVEDNMQCGGMNVSFTGIYVRLK